MTMRKRPVIKLSPAREAALIGVLGALCIASREFLQMLPNIKPVTSIIIISVMLFGLRFGLCLTFVVTVVSSMLLGMGTWTMFQLLAWAVVCLATEGLMRLCSRFHLRPRLVPMALFSACMGYVFGFFVSLEKLLLGGYKVFIAYWMSGLFFDTLHAFGNFAFYLICAPVLMRIFRDAQRDWQPK